MKVTDLVKIKNSDIKIQRNTYITPVKSFENFIRDELVWVKRISGFDTIVFRPWDGNEYVLTQSQLKHFKLTGR